MNRFIGVMADALAALDDGVLALDESCFVTYANPRAEQILESRFSTLEGKILWEELPVAKAAGLEAACSRAAGGRAPVTMEWGDAVRAARLECRVASTSSGFVIRIRDVSRRTTAEAEEKELHERIENERSLFRAVLEQMPSGAIVAGPTGKLLFGNRQFEVLFAGQMIGADDIEGYGGYVGFHPDGRRYDPAEWPLARSLSSGEVVSDERVVLERRDGKRIVARFRSGPIYHANGRLIGGVVFMDDVTAEMESLRDLTVTKSLLQGIMDHSMSVIYAKDPSGRYLFVNRRFLNLFSVGSSKVIGSTVHDVFPRETADAFRIADEEVMTKNTPVEIEEITPGEDGPHTYISAKFPVRDETGRVYAVGGVSTDITGRMREKQERDATLALLDTFLTASPVGFAVMDAEIRFSRVNETLARINGYSVEEHLGKTPRELFPDLPEGVEDAIRRVLTTGEPVINLEVALTARAQASAIDAGAPPRMRYFWCSFYPIRIAGRIEAAGAAVVDVTEQKELAHQLLHEGELRELFMAVLAHDLRNPLAAISLGAAALKRSPGISPEAAQRAQLVVNSAKRMSALIEQLLDLSRVRSGNGLPLERKHCDLSPLCADVIHEIEASHPTRAIVFSAKGDTYGTWDPDRLSQVVSNLVNNAVTYSPDTTKVCVELTGDERQVSLSVRNEGSPIPAVKLSKLFEPFERASRETHSPSEGLGLGLFIADQVVRAHGGSIEAKSDPWATVFDVRLPRVCASGSG